MDNDPLDRIINYEIYIKNMPTNDIVELKSRKFRGSSSALTVLSQRDKTILIPLCTHILLEDFNGALIINNEDGFWDRQDYKLFITNRNHETV